MTAYRGTLDKINGARDKTESAITKIKALMTKVEGDTHRVEGAIRSKCSYMRQLIDTKEKELIQTVHIQK